MKKRKHEQRVPAGAEMTMSKRMDRVRAANAILIVVASFD